MLSDKKISVSGISTIDGVGVSKFAAIIEGDDCRFLETQIDKKACMDNRDTVRADRAEFEDFAYEILNMANKN